MKYTDHHSEAPRMFLHHVIDVTAWTDLDFALGAQALGSPFATHTHCSAFAPSMPFHSNDYQSEWYMRPFGSLIADQSHYVCSGDGPSHDWMLWISRGHHVSILKHDTLAL